MSKDLFLKQLKLIDPSYEDAIDTIAGLDDSNIGVGRAELVHEILDYTAYYTADGSMIPLYIGSDYVLVFQYYHQETDIGAIKQPNQRVFKVGHENFIDAIYEGLCGCRVVNGLPYDKTFTFKDNDNTPQVDLEKTVDKKPWIL